MKNNAFIDCIQQELLQIVRNRLLPWAHSGGGYNCVLAKPPLHVPPNVHISTRPTPPLPKATKKRSYFYLMRWREANLEALRFPYLGCVLEGEADLIVGKPIVTSSKKTSPDEKRTADKDQQMILTVPPKNFLIYPPGIPKDAGERPHWIRPHPERMQTKIFWVNVLSTGVSCHTCTTIKGQHSSHTKLYFHDPDLLTLTNLLLTELEARGQHYELAVQSYLITLLVHLERGIGSDVAVSTNEMLHPLNISETVNNTENNNALVLQRACQYIKAHLDETLSPALIARNTYISKTHLMRLFRQKKGITVMKYVTQCRIEFAKSLLTDTNLPIQEVGWQVGYRRLSHFSQVFSTEVGLSPLAFRRQTLHP